MCERAIPRSGARDNVKGRRRMREYAASSHRALRTCAAPRVPLAICSTSSSGRERPKKSGRLRCVFLEIPEDAGDTSWHNKALRSNRAALCQAENRQPVLPGITASFASSLHFNQSPDFQLFAPSSRPSPRRGQRSSSTIPLPTFYGVYIPPSASPLAT